MLPGLRWRKPRRSGRVFALVQGHFPHHSCSSQRPRVLHCCATTPCIQYRRSLFFRFCLSAMRPLQSQSQIKESRKRSRELVAEHQEMGLRVQKYESEVQEIKLRLQASEQRLAKAEAANRELTAQKVLSTTVEAAPLPCMAQLEGSL